MNSQHTPRVPSLITSSSHTPTPLSPPSPSTPAIVRGVISRKKSIEKKRLYLQNQLRGSSATKLQSAYRGYVARKYVRKLRRYVSARNVQRCFRGNNKSITHPL